MARRAAGARGGADRVVAEDGADGHVEGAGSLVDRDEQRGVVRVQRAPVGKGRDVSS